MTNDTLEGRVIDGRYELLERIGEGAMGAVYRAHQDIVDREVAVKLLHSEAADDPDYRARFEREAKALGKLDHDGCVRVHDFGWWDEIDAPFLVAEFVHGEPMHRRIGGLAVDQVVAFGLAIADAMQHAHEQGIIHRDLKPENVIVCSPEETDELKLKVVDFGLARMPADEEVRLTRAGDAYGTPAYMSPEQCRADDDIGPPADVYGLGCMLWEMLHDRLPYEGTSASAVLIKHVTNPVPAVEHDVPESLADLVVRMMDKSPAARPAMAEVASTLRALRPPEVAQTVDDATADEKSARSTRQLGPPAPTPAAEASTLTTPSVERSRVPLVAGLALFAIVIAGFWFVERDGGPTTSTPDPTIDRSETAPATKELSAKPVATTEAPEPAKTTSQQAPTKASEKLAEAAEPDHAERPRNDAEAPAPATKAERADAQAAESAPTPPSSPSNPATEPEESADDDDERERPSVKLRY
jgi:serine/threonine-protein kinase